LLVYELVNHTRTVRDTPGSVHVESMYGGRVCSMADGAPCLARADAAAVNELSAECSMHRVK
jgi:hypothetical protein